MLTDEHQKVPRVKRMNVWMLELALKKPIHDVFAVLSDGYNIQYSLSPGVKLSQVNLFREQIKTTHANWFNRDLSAAC